MNKYELYKLKVAGLSNEQVFRIVSYWEMNGDWPDLEQIAQLAGCRNQALFIERYIRIDDQILREEFKEFDSISIMDEEYPEELLWMHNPPVLLFMKEILICSNTQKLLLLGVVVVAEQGFILLRKLSMN